MLFFNIQFEKSIMRNSHRKFLNDIISLLSNKTKWNLFDKCFDLFRLCNRLFKVFDSTARITWIVFVTPPLPKIYMLTNTLTSSKTVSNFSLLIRYPHLSLSLSLSLSLPFSHISIPLSSWKDFSLSLVLLECFEPS